MLNLRQQQQAFVKFDQNLYNFEKKRQNVDNKVKEKEKEIIEKNKNKLQNKKIQINFKNSFVNQNTQEKYDKIIESNTKKNNEKIERIMEKEMKKVENVVNLINKVEAYEDEIYQKSLKNKIENKNEEFNNQNENLITDAKNNNNESDVTTLNLNFTKMDNTTCNNESEMILIESVSHFKSKFSDNSHMNITEDKSDINKNKFDIFPIIDETLKYDSENENEDENEDNTEIILNDNTVNNNENIINDQIEENIIYEKIEENITNKIKKNNPYSMNVFEETYDQFLEDSIDFINKKDSVQQILRNQMKNIVNNIKDRKKDKKSQLEEKKKILLNNLISVNEIKEQKIEFHINTNLENKLEDDLDYPCNYDNNKNIPELLTFGKLKIESNKNNINDDQEKEYLNEFININEDIQNDQEDELDDEDVTTIHQSIQIDNKNLEDERKFDINEFIKENTRDEIIINNTENLEDMTNYKSEENDEYFNNYISNKNENEEKEDEDEELTYQEIEPIKEDNIINNNINNIFTNFDNNRVLIFDNYEDSSLLEIKKKKLEIIKEKKIKDLEIRREKSKSKSKTKNNQNNQNITNIKNNKNNNENIKPRIKSANLINKNKINNSTNNIIKSNSNNSNLSDISNNSISRVPIKITREEAQIANKKIKSNVNFTKLSNKKSIISSIKTVCLAGEPNRVCREKILEIVEKCPCENFVILFKGNFGRFVIKFI